MAGTFLRILLPAAALIIAGCGTRQSPPGLSSLAGSDSVTIFDHHVHVMSPALVGRWKTLGASFSKPDYAYSDVDSILRFNPAGGMFLISMAYLYATPPFTDSSELANVRRENDYVAGLARRHPGRLYAFCGIDPLRDYARAELLRCRKESGMYGLKLHFASSGVNLKDPSHLARVREVLAVAAREGMPVVLHLDDRSEGFDASDVDLLIDSLLVPGPAMELYVAHLGTSGGYTNTTRTILQRFTAALGGIPALGRHRIFFDLSAVGLTEPLDQVPALTPGDFADLSGQLTGLGLERVVFGTDYPVFNSTAYLSALETNMTLTKDELIRILGNGVPPVGRPTDVP